MSDTAEVTAVDAWISGDMAKAQELNQPIPDNGPAAAPLSGEVPEYLRNHLEIQNLEQKRAAAPDPAQAEGAMLTRAATKLTELGPEGHALVQEWGGSSSIDFRENLAYAKAAFEDVAANRPDLIAKVDASGLGNDPAVLKILSELGRQKAHTYGDNTVSSRRSSNDEPQRAIPRGQSARQTEINKIMKDNPPGSEGYRDPAVQRRLQQLHGAVGQAGDLSMIGRSGRTA